MRIEPLPGFKPLETHHCVTGSMRHVYLHSGFDLSEDMLLGLGEGVSFSYWQFKGQPPFLGGRGVPKPSMEQIAGQRTGVRIEIHTSSSPRKARQAMFDLLDAGQPVMLQVDMGFLPYFDFGGEEYHFGGHVIVACGYDAQSNQVLVADRDGLHPIPMADLEKARASTFKPFAPKHRWYSFDFSKKRPPTPDDVRRAIDAQTDLMLEPPIGNIGVKGIRKAARMIPQWPKSMSEKALRSALFNAYIFICPIGGTGGGTFRYMFSRFLREAAGIIGDGCLAVSAAEFKSVGDEWEALGEWFRRTSEARDPASRLHECVAPLQHLADLEEAAWTRLGTAV